MCGFHQYRVAVHNGCYGTNFMGKGSPHEDVCVIALREVVVAFSCVLARATRSRSSSTQTNVAIVSTLLRHDQCHRNRCQPQSKLVQTLQPMGSTVLEFFGCIIKPSGCRPQDFMCIFRILNPVDPLASASNLYLVSWLDHDTIYTFILSYKLCSTSSHRVHAAVVFRYVQTVILTSIILQPCAYHKCFN